MHILSKKKKKSGFSSLVKPITTECNRSIYDSSQNMSNATKNNKLVGPIWINWLKAVTKQKLK